MSNMRLIRLSLIASLFVSSLSAQSPKASSVEQLIERVHDMHRKGVVLELAPTPNDFQAAAAKTFNVTARQFEFVFSPSPFVVNQGDSVTLRLTATDSGEGFGHGFFLERYAENFLTLPKNQTLTINFVASEPGTFFFFCTVTCGIGHTGMSGEFIVNAVTAPAITSFAPASGSTAGGNNVVITGTGFQSGATVKFESDAATAIFNNATTITAVAPPHAAGPVTITVTNTDGLSATSAQQYTYIVPAPTISSVTPASGSTVGGTALTIAGSGFIIGATVKLGSLDAINVSVTSATSLTATTPLGPSNVPAAGQALDVVMTNPDATTATKTGGFTYTLPAPSIASISPNRGALTGGAVVTIIGTGFTTALPTTVTFGGTAGTSVTVVDAVTLRATTPAHAEGAVNVVVTVGGTNATATNGFTYATTPPKRRSVKK